MMKIYKFVVLLSLILPMHSFAENTEQSDLCQFKQKFDDTIPAEKSFVKLGGSVKFNVFLLINYFMKLLFMTVCTVQINSMYCLRQLLHLCNL